MEKLSRIFQDVVLTYSNMHTINSNPYKRGRNTQDGVLMMFPPYFPGVQLIYRFRGCYTSILSVLRTSFCPSCFTTEGPQSFVAIAAGDAHVTQQTTFDAQERFCGPFWIPNGLGLCGAIVTVTCNLQQF